MKNNFNHVLFVVDHPRRTVKYYVWKQEFKDDPKHGPFDQDICTTNNVNETVGKILLQFRPTSVTYVT